MSDQSEGIAHRYCLSCGTVLEPDTSGPCECPGGSSAFIAKVVRRVTKMHMRTTTELMFVGTPKMLLAMLLGGVLGLCLSSMTP